MNLGTSPTPMDLSNVSVEGMIPGPALISAPRAKADVRPMPHANDPISLMRYRPTLASSTSLSPEYPL